MIRNNVQDIRNELLNQLNNGRFVTDKSGVKTIEIVSASFIADEPAIFGTVNQDYVDRELAWYKSMSLNVNDIPPPVPAIWKAVATEDGFINSNYGNLIWSSENYNQFESCAKQLESNIDSRRAIMIYTRPSIQIEYNKDGMSDFICTNAVQYLIRDNKLNAYVSMRSNDAIFGFRNDYAWQKHVLDSLVVRLNGMYPNLIAGDIYWNAASFHVYERHFHLVK